uniref:Ig-like domain-containing protein n=1 Tax=Anolis carolinensis TaxID=28377 RepID=A0A803T1B2_ANOCA
MYTWISLLLFSLPGSDSAVTVTQEPLLTSLLQQEKLTIKCSVNSQNYNFLWYRQLPGKIELQVLGNLYSYESKLADVDSTLDARLSGEWLDSGKEKMNLHLQSLQPGDTGLYLCAAKDTVREAGTGAGTKRSSLGTPALNPIPSSLSISSGVKSITLVCLAHGFSYAWPLDVIWKRDGQAVPRFSAATEEPKAEGKCSFGIASRLSIATSEWKEGHTYSCHVHSTCRIPILPSVEELQRWRH